MEWSHFASGAFSMLGSILILGWISMKIDEKEERLKCLEKQCSENNYKLTSHIYKPDPWFQWRMDICDELHKLKFKVDSIKVPCSKK